MSVRRWVLAGTSALALACVLIDPPREEPVPSPRRPTFVSVAPTTATPVTSLPGDFTVCIDAEPSVPPSLRLFIDQLSSDGFLATYDPVYSGDPTCPFSAVIKLEPTQVGDPKICHSITIFAAYNYDPQSKLPAGNGGSYVTWFYEPAQGCVVDGGAFPDANSAFDASDGAPE